MTNTQAHRLPDPWPPAYEELLRAHLPMAPADMSFAASDGLFDLGLDSFALVELLVALEETFGVSLPDEALTAETFATAGSLWEALAGALDEPVPDASVGPPR